MEHKLVDRLKNHSQSPNPQVWERIAMSLDDDKRPALWGFSQRQVAALLIGGLLIFSFSTFMAVNGISEVDKVEKFDNKITYTQPSVPIQEKEEVIEKEVEKPKISKTLVQRSKVAHNNHLPKLQSRPKTISQSKPEVRKPKSANLDGVDEDYLARLNKRIERVNPITYELAEEEVPQLALKNEVKKPMVKEQSEKPEIVKNSSIEKNQDNKKTLKIKEDNTIVKVDDKKEYSEVEELAEVQKKYSKFYLMPYVGANFTQVFYQGTPNSPYFGDNAVFNGKFGYNSGLIGGYMFSKHWGVESGISFGQYIQSFKEDRGDVERKGDMYIDQLDIPLMAKYMIHFGTEDYRKQLSFKAGLMYNSVLRYQVNYTDKDMRTLETRTYNHDADKRLYNSLQMGYVAGLDFDAFITRRLSLNLGTTTSIVSQLENFPRFRKDIRRPIQVSTNFSVGVKYNF